MPTLDYTIHELLPRADSIGASMLTLVDAHREEYPGLDWSPYYKIPYESEIEHLRREWFPTVIANEPPKNVPVAGFWFGLFNPSTKRDNKRDTVADFYIAGARHFELDGNNDWAVKPAYFPEGRYANSRELATIYQTAYAKPDGLANEAEQYLCLGYVAFALKFILADADLDLLLGDRESAGVALGWDSGDPHYVGFLSHDGFRVRDPAEAIAGIEKRAREFKEWFKKEYPDSE
jgi:hypothetical protein